MRIFIYESLSAGALGTDAPASLLREGLAMRSAVMADFAKIADIVTLDPGPDEPNRFLEAVRDTDATLVIAPEFDGILAERSEWVRNEGRRLLGSPPDAVRRTADKFALARHWRACGIPTPENEIARRDVSPTGPVVIKPRDGAGSQATRLVRDPAAWPGVFDAVNAEMPGRDFLVQPFHSGKACSVAFLVGPVQAIALAAAEQHLADDFQYRGGRLPLSREDSRRAIDLAGRALDGLGLAGYVGVDLVLGDRDVVIEINPRVTTSYIGLRELCRDNLALAWLDVLEGGTPTLAWRDGPVSFLADGSLIR